MNKAQVFTLGQEPVLSTRQRGREAADRLQDLLQAGSVVISFVGVEVATPSFLDELLARIQSVVKTNEQVMVVVTGMNEDVQESLELVIEHRKMMLGALENGHVELLGGKRYLQQTLEKAVELGRFRATDLADELELKLPNLHQRLKALREAGVIGRQADETAQRGRRHDYETLDTAQTLVGSSA